MKIRVAAFAAILMFSLPLSAHEPAAPAVAASHLPEAAREAAAAVDAFHAALRKGDRESASALLTDEVLIYEAGGVERTKAEYASHHLGADMAFSQAVSAVVTRRAGYCNGSLAWIASESRVKGTYKGTAVDAVTAETMVLRKLGGEWKIAHIHWSSADKP